MFWNVLDGRLRFGWDMSHRESLFHGYINPYYWVDDHPLLYGNNESLDPGKYRIGYMN